MARGKIIIWMLCALLLLVTASDLSAAGNATSYDYMSVGEPAVDISHIKLSKLDPNLLITAGKVQELTQVNRDLVLVDVRRAEDFQAIHIPGSINIPIHAIGSRDFLKSKTIVLLDEGHSYGKFETEAAKLHEAGFSAVSILAGGMAAWKRSGNKLVGSPRAGSRLNKIKPAEFISESRFDHWKILYIADKGNDDFQVFFRDVIQIPFSTNNGRFISAVRNEIRELTDKSALTLLLFADRDGSLREKAESALADLDFPYVYFLEGGLKGLKASISDQKLIVGAKNNPRMGRNAECK